MGPSSRIVTEYLSVARFPRARLCQTHKPLEQSGRTIVWLDGRSGRDVVVKIVGRCTATGDGGLLVLGGSLVGMW